MKINSIYNPNSKSKRTTILEEIEYSTAAEKVSYDPISLEQVKISGSDDNNYLLHDAWYKAIIQNTSEGFFISDLKGKFLDVNDAYCLMTGYTRGELLKMGLYDIELRAVTYPEDRIKMERYFQKVKERGENYNEFLEVKHKCKDGHIIDISVCMKYMNIMGGILFHFERDITESNRLFKQVKESEELYRSLIDLGGKVGEAVVMLMDTEKIRGLQIFVSDKWVEMIGYSKEELLKMSFFNIVHPSFRKGSIERHQAKMDGEVIPGLFELTVIKKDGTEFPIEITSAISIYQGNKVNVVYIRDITERKKIISDVIKIETRTKTLQESERIKNNFLSMISHELRTPLASIKGFSSTLLQKDVQWNENEKIDFIQEIYTEADRLARLVNDLLDVSSLESKTFKLRKELCAVDIIIQESLNYFTRIIDNRELILDIGKNLPLVMCDKERIVQIISNLLDNAAKYSPNESQITIKITGNKENIIVSVTDKGIGISEQDKENLFNRFYQVEKIALGEKRGTGLGLSICKGIVEEHGGKIWVDSKKGAGSTFSFSLPVYNS
jgi:PAS domain S-box-containing protein